MVRARVLPRSVAEGGRRMAVSVPRRRIRSSRLLLRCWNPSDAPMLRTALEVSWAELQRWIPWVFAERQTLPELELRLQEYRDDFVAGKNALYAVMDPGGTEVWGGAGLYRRVGPGALEIGYWVRSDRTGRGIATEAASLLTLEGFELTGIERIEIRCDPAHVASAAVPRKLGYRHRETLVGRPEGSEEGGDTMVFEMSAHQFRDLAAKQPPPP